MKRSEIYEYAQFAVLKDGGMAADIKLAILKRLMADEEIAQMLEKADKEAGENV